MGPLRAQESAAHLASEIDRHKPGDRVTLKVLRNNQMMDVQVTLDEAPNR
jgi:S1-C subfamily serine protease